MAEEQCSVQGLARGPFVEFARLPKICEHIVSPQLPVERSADWVGEQYYLRVVLMCLSVINRVKHLFIC